MRRLLIFCILAAVQLRAEPVLVVPFFNVSTAKDLAWISESISQTIRESLAAGGVIVVARRDRQEVYRRLGIKPNARLTHASVMKVAEALDASHVIYGEYDFTPAPAGAPAGARGSLRIAATILDMGKMRKGPDLAESGPLEELAALETRLSWQALRVFAPETTPSAEAYLNEHPPVRLDAMENYIRGLLAASNEQKHRYFMQAARLDAHFSQPCFELGRLYWEEKQYGLAAEWLAKVQPAAESYLEANFLLGLCRYYDGDYAEAAKAFETVAGSVPLNEVWNNLAAAQSQIDAPEALGNFRKAIEGDPSDPDYHFNAGYELWKRGNFDAAAESFRAALDR
jgi:Tfp pilus assembly protein PilF